VTHYQPSIFGEFDRERAAEEKAEGMARAVRADRVQAYKTAAWEWISDQRRGMEIAADDLTLAIGVPDEGANRVNVIGALFSAWAKAGLIVFTGRIRPSDRISRHKGFQRVWRVL